MFQPNIYITNPNQIDRTRLTAEQRVNELALTTGTSSSVLNYVIFREIEFKKGGLDSVHIGMKYANNNDPNPSRQWCMSKRRPPNFYTTMKQFSWQIRKGMTLRKRA